MNWTTFWEILLSFVSFGLVFVLWSCWRYLGIPWTFTALSMKLFLTDSNHQLDPGHNSASGFPHVPTLDLAPGSPAFHLLVFMHSWEPQLLGQFFTNHEGNEFPTGLLLDCMSPLTEGPRENYCLFSLSLAQVHNLTCVPHLFTLKEFPLQALLGLLKDAPAFLLSRHRSFITPLLQTVCIHFLF